MGAYEVTVSHPGFSPARRAVTLTVGSAFDLAIALTVAGAQSAVTVDAKAAVIETARTQIAGTVSQAEVHALPLNGRNFLDLALLVPGVSPTNTASNQLFAETSAVPGQGISVGSQRNFSNNFIVDGLSANDDAAGLSGIFYGLDVVQEFQVVTSGGQAELGRALGGYVNVVTKSGTNALHGDLYGYFRNQRFNAANPLSNTKLPLTQAQYGASLGGPVIQDRTFYFANFEQRSLNQSGLITIAPANVAAINAHLAAVGYQGEQIATGLFPNPVHNTNFLGKVDHQFSGKDQFAVRYSLYDVHSNNSRGAGALSAATASAGLDDTDQTLAVSNVATLSAHTVNETRGQFTNSTLSALPTDPIGPAVSISGRGDLRHAFRVAHRAAEQALRNRRQPLAPGGFARAACRSGLPVQRLHHHVSPVDKRRLHFFVAGQLPHRDIQQLGLHADFRQYRGVADQSECRLLRAGRVEGQPPPYLESRASATTCSF